MNRRLIINFILIAVTVFLMIVSGVLAECLTDERNGFSFNFCIELMSNCAGLLAGVFVAERILRHEREQAREAAWRRVGPYTITLLWTNSVQIFGLGYRVFREATTGLSTPELHRYYHDAFDRVTQPSEAAVIALKALQRPLATYLRENTLAITMDQFRTWYDLALPRLQHINTVCTPRIIEGADELQLNELLVSLESTAQLMAGKMNYMDVFPNEIHHDTIREVIEDMLDVCTDCWKINSYLVQHRDRIPGTP